MIQRARSQPLKSTFALISSTVKGNFTSIYKKCTQFLASATMYMRYALLYSMLRNITVERTPQKRTFSSTRLWWCGIVTFF